MSSYKRFEEGPEKIGWMLDMTATTIPDDSGVERSGLDVYFLEQVCIGQQYLKTKTRDTYMCVTTFLCRCLCPPFPWSVFLVGWGQFQDYGVPSALFLHRLG